MTTATKRVLASLAVLGSLFGATLATAGGASAATTHTGAIAPQSLYYHC